MKISTSYIITILVGICTFIKYGTSCDTQCDLGYRCVMRRSTCPYPPCPYFPTCVQQHNRPNRRHRQRHAPNNRRRHESRHRRQHRHNALLNALFSDTNSESQEVETITSHPGVCPAPLSNPPCINTCRNDGDCQSNEKCCGNGCGQVCTQVNNVIKDKPGTCSSRVRTLIHDCSTECNHDNQCPGIQKCCSTACGSKCSDPCFHWLNVGQRSNRRASIWQLPYICRS